MADDPLTIGELGGYTNNQMNKEGIKKLVKIVNEGVSGDSYTKEEVNALLDEKQDIVEGGENISISNNVINFDNKSEWVLCENGITDIITYQNTHEFVIDTGSTFGKYYFNSVIKDILTQNSDLRFIPMVRVDNEQTNPCYIHFNYSASKILIINVDVEHNIAYKLNNSRIRQCRDLVSGTAIDATNADTYIDSTTGDILKPFYIILRPSGNWAENSDFCLLMLPGAKDSFSLVRGDNAVFWGPQLNATIIYNLIKGTNDVYGDKYTLKTNTTYEITITADTKIYRRKKLTPNVELEQPTP